MRITFAPSPATGSTLGRPVFPAAITPRIGRRMLNRSGANSSPPPPPRLIALPPPKGIAASAWKWTQPPSAAEALEQQLAHPTPGPRPPASLRRWQCLKTGALWQLDATPQRWFPADHRNYPLLDLLADCSRVCTGAKIYYREDLLAYLDFLPAAFREHGLPLELYVDSHSLFFPQHPEALAPLGAALHF